MGQNLSRIAEKELRESQQFTRPAVVSRQQSTGDGASSISSKSQRAMSEGSRSFLKRRRRRKRQSQDAASDTSKEGSCQTTGASTYCTESINGNAEMIRKDAAAAAANNGTAEEEEKLPEGIEEFILKKRRNGGVVGGVHWQEDPTGKTWLHNNLWWPRDFATIRGRVIVHKGEKWLLATQVRQLGSKKWRTAPKGAAMPFRYGDRYRLVPKSHLVTKPRAFPASSLEFNSSAALTVASNTKKNSRTLRPTTSNVSQDSGVSSISSVTDVPTTRKAQQQLRDKEFKQDLCLMFPGSDFQGLLYIEHWQESTAGESSEEQVTKRMTFQTTAQAAEEPAPISNELLVYFLQKTMDTDENNGSVRRRADLLTMRAMDWFPKATLIGADAVGFDRWCESRPPWQIMEVLEVLQTLLQDFYHQRRTLTMETVAPKTMVAKVSAPKAKFCSVRPHMAGRASLAVKQQNFSIPTTETKYLQQAMQSRLQGK